MIRPYYQSLAAPPNYLKHISQVLLRCTRNPSWGPVLDPIALSILNDPKRDDILSAIPHDVEPLSGGASSLVLARGDSHVVRIGPEQPRAAIDEMLQSVAIEYVGQWMIETLPRVDTDSVTQADVDKMHRLLAQKQYVFCDPGTDNLGRLPNGNLVVIDPGAISYKTPYKDFDQRVPAASDSLSPAECHELIDPMLRLVTHDGDKDAIFFSLLRFPAGALHRLRLADVTFSVVDRNEPFSHHAVFGGSDGKQPAGRYTRADHHVTLSSTEHHVVVHEAAHAWDGSHGDTNELFSQYTPQFRELARVGFDISIYPVSDSILAGDRTDPVGEQAAEAIRAYLNVADDTHMPGPDVAGKLKAYAPRVYGLINALLHNDEQQFNRERIRQRSLNADDKRGMKDRISEAIAQAHDAPTVMTAGSSEKLRSALGRLRWERTYTQNITLAAFERHIRRDANATNVYPRSEHLFLLQSVNYEAIAVAKDVYVGVPGPGHPHHRANPPDLRNARIFDLDIATVAASPTTDPRDVAALPLDLSCAYRNATPTERKALAMGFDLLSRCAPSAERTLTQGPLTQDQAPIAAMER